MFESQKESQASSLFVFGGVNTTIADNEFAGHRNWAESFMKAFAYDLFHYFPPNYFKYSQASVIRIEYPYEVYPEIIAARAE